MKPVPNVLWSVEQLFDLHSDENLKRRPIKTLNMLLLTPVRDPIILENLEALFNIKCNLKKSDLFKGAGSTVEQVRKRSIGISCFLIGLRNIWLI